MSFFAVSLGVIAGICLGTGLIHLFIGLRRPGGDMKHFAFGLFALAYGGAVLTGLLMYRAADLPQYLTADRWSGLLAGLTYISLIWFVAVYAEVQPLPFLVALTVLFAVLITAHLTRPTLIHGEIVGISVIALPWGEKITFLEAAESIWESIFILAQLVTIAFVFYVCYRQYRQGDRQEALLLGTGILLFAAAIVFDVLVESGLVDFVLASDFGFLPLAIVMSLELSSDIIQTENELARHRNKLEELVKERTAELEEMNVQLGAEVRERRLTEETLQHRVEELAVLSRITQTLVSVTELPLALEQVCEAAAHQFDAQFAYVIWPSTEEPELQILVGFESDSGPVGPTPLPVSLSETPYFDRALSQGETLTVSDVQVLPIAALLRGHIARQQIQNTMLVPLVMRGRAIGLLAIATERADLVFTPDQILLAETIAGDVASAIENARLFERAQAAAVTEERSRLARELHDSVTQLLFSINLIALSLGRLWKRDPDMAERSTGELQRLARGALAEMRTLLRELRPQTIAATELVTLLDQLSDGLAARHDIPVEVEVGPDCDLPEKVHVALYRIAQEALNNITKHAEASQVTIRLACDDAAVQLDIVDDGQGFDPEDVSAGQMGLDIMRERALAIGAEVLIDSQPGKGTSIAVTWPIPNSEGGADARS